MTGRDTDKGARLAETRLAREEHMSEFRQFDSGVAQLLHLAGRLLTFVTNYHGKGRQQEWLLDRPRS